MALKRKITAAEHAALADHFKAEYKPLGDGFVLDTDDAAELERALETVKAEAKTAKEQLDALQAAKDEADRATAAAVEEAARKKGDVSALEASWQKKLDDAAAAGAKVADALRGQLRTLLVTNKAMEIATAISTVPELLIPAIEKRLQADIDGDNAKTRVLDADGKPTAATLDELKQEFVANDKYAAIIIGSKASGGHSDTNRTTGQPGSKKITEMSETERRAAYERLGAEGFQKQLNADRAA